MGVEGGHVNWLREAVESFTNFSLCSGGASSQRALGRLRFRLPFACNARIRYRASCSIDVSFIVPDEQGSRDGSEFVVKFILSEIDQKGRRAANEDLRGSPNHSHSGSFVGATVAQSRFLVAL